jgi:hypothetical protein
MLEEKETPAPPTEETEGSKQFSSPLFVDASPQRDLNELEIPPQEDTDIDNEN